MKVIAKFGYFLVLILIMLPWTFILFEKEFSDAFVNRFQIFSTFSDWRNFVNYVAISMSVLILVLLLIVILWPPQRARYEIVNEDRQKLSITEKSIQNVIKTTLLQSRIYEPSVAVKIFRKKIVVRAKGYTTNDKDLTLQAQTIKQLVNKNMHKLIGESKFILNVDIDLDTDKNARARVL